MKNRFEHVPDEDTNGFNTFLADLDDHASDSEPDSPTNINGLLRNGIFGSDYRAEVHPDFTLGSINTDGEGVSARTMPNLSNALAFMMPHIDDNHTGLMLITFGAVTNELSSSFSDDPGSSNDISDPANNNSGSLSDDPDFDPDSFLNELDENVNSYEESDSSDEDEDSSDDEYSNSDRSLSPF